jgi:hypothetical protein
MKKPPQFRRRRRPLGKVIPLFQQDGKATIKQRLSEIYNAIYLLDLATDIEDIEI